MPRSGRHVRGLIVTVIDRYYDDVFPGGDHRRASALKPRLSCRALHPCRFGNPVSSGHSGSNSEASALPCSCQRRVPSSDSVRLPWIEKSLRGCLGLNTVQLIPSPFDTTNPALGPTRYSTRSSCPSLP